VIVNQSNQDPDNDHDHLCYTSSAHDHLSMLIINDILVNDYIELRFHTSIITITLNLE
jgi:hypothetical protein